MEFLTSNYVEFPLIISFWILVFRRHRAKKRQEVQGATERFVLWAVFVAGMAFVVRWFVFDYYPGFMD